MMERKSYIMNKVKFLIPLGMMIVLSACGATKEQEESSMAYTQSKLPDGCKLEYAGKVVLTGEHYDSRIFYVKCGDTVTISESHEVQQGKITTTQTDVTITKN